MNNLDPRATILEAQTLAFLQALDAQTGPTIAVGHSYGGAVITGAVVGNPNVKALVYIAAFGPAVYPAR